MFSSRIINRLTARFVTKSRAMSSHANPKPFFNGVHGERNFNDAHPVLAVLTFATIFGSGFGSFQLLRTVYESVTNNVSFSVEFADFSDDEE
jgi:hypothetical protein